MDPGNGDYGHTSEDQPQPSKQQQQPPPPQQYREEPRPYLIPREPPTENGFTKILDKLYLTSAKHMTAKNLVEHNVTHIVNATKTIPVNQNYAVYRVNVMDSQYEKIGAHFDAVGEFISNAMNNNGCVVVHCISGISRSSTLVIAFLMKYRNMYLKEAFNFVRSKRWFIRPNTGFIRQLIDYETKLFNTNSVQMVYHEPTGFVPDFILEDKTNYKFFYLCIKK